MCPTSELYTSKMQRIIHCLPASTLPPSSVMCFQHLRVGHWAVGTPTNKWYLIISLVPRTGWHLCMFSGWDLNKILFLFVNLKRGKKFLSLCMIHALHNTLCYAACWDQFPIFKFALTHFKAVRLQKRSIGGPVKCWGEKKHVSKSWCIYACFFLPTLSGNAKDTWQCLATGFTLAWKHGRESFLGATVPLK